MLYELFAISLIIIEGVLILIAFKILRNIQSISKDFVTVLGEAKKDIYPLFDELEGLIALTNKKENYILHMTFILGEIRVYIKMIFEELELEKDTKSTNN